MNQLLFHVNGQVVSYFSLLIMTTAIIYSLTQRKLAGYRLPHWSVYIYVFLALDAIAGVILTGFQLTNTPYFYSGRRLFSLFAILFIFLSIFDFQHRMPIQGFLSERTAMLVFVIMQMLFNVSWLVLNFSNPIWLMKLTWLNIPNDIMLPLNFLWMALLSQRKGVELQIEGKLAAAKTLSRFSWFFWFGMLLATVIALRTWLPFAAQVHPTVSSYGWMILCALTVLIFSGFGREISRLYSQITLLVMLILLLAVSLIAEFFHNNIGMIVTLGEMDRLMRPFILIQLGIALLIFLALPRWLAFILPTEAPHTSASAQKKTLTSRQKEVMRLLAKGQSNPQIAAALHITEQTAKYHVSKLMVEQGKSSRHELGELAQQLMHDHVIKNE